MKNFKISKSKYLLMGMLILFLTITTLLMLYRYHRVGSFIVSEDSYNDLINANDYQNSLNLYDFFLKFNYNNMSLIPYGLIFSILIFLFMINISFHNEKYPLYMVIPSIIFMFSPTFLYHSLNISEILLGFLFLCGIFAFRSKFRWLAYIFAILIGFLSFNNSILLGLIILAFSLFLKEKGESRILVNHFFIIFLVSIIKTFFETGFKFDLGLNAALGYSNYVFEFGNLFGVSVIVLVIAILGMLLFWSKQNILFNLILILVGVLSLFTGNIFLFNFVVSIFAGLIISYLIYSPWSIQVLKYLSIALIVLSLIFNLIAFSNFYLSEEPNIETLEVYDFISKQASIEKVLLDNAYGSSFKYHTDKNYVLDEGIARQIYYSTILNYTVSNLNQEGITHILFSEKQKLEVWEGREIGLLIMVQNDQFFKKVYSYKNYELYEVLK